MPAGHTDRFDPKRENATIGLSFEMIDRFPGLYLDHRPAGAVPRSFWENSGRRIEQHRSDFTGTFCSAPGFMLASNFRRDLDCSCEESVVLELLATAARGWGYQRPPTVDESSGTNAKWNMLPLGGRRVGPGSRMPN